VILFIKERADTLLGRGIIASVSPYESRHTRITPGIYDSPEEINTVLSAIRDLV
jgi:isopenicillin-N epimerase